MKQHLPQRSCAPDLVEFLSLDNDQFKRRFANTPMLRTKRRGFLRNVCVALGNMRARPPCLLSNAPRPTRSH